MSKNFLSISIFFVFSFTFSQQLSAQQTESLIKNAYATYLRVKEISKNRTLDYDTIVEEKLFSALSDADRKMISKRFLIPTRTLKTESKLEGTKISVRIFLAGNVKNHVIEFADILSKKTIIIDDQKLYLDLSPWNSFEDNYKSLKKQIKSNQSLFVYNGVWNLIAKALILPFSVLGACTSYDDELNQDLSNQLASTMDAYKKKGIDAAFEEFEASEKKIREKETLLGH